MDPMKDKICIVTGANSGIGRETALALAKKGAHIVMVCRNQKRGEEAKKEIITISGNDSVELMLCDLASQKSIRKFAKAFLEKHDRLDVLVNNAGVMMWERTLTTDGIETTFAVNHLGSFLLTNLLLEMLKKSAPSRIVNVASKAQKEIDFEDLQNERGYSMRTAYGRSKLANILFTYELARRLEGTSVTANCLHPGVVNTNLFKHAIPYPLSYGLKVVEHFFKKPKDGAKTSIYLASSKYVECISGKYFIGTAPAKSHRQSYDIEACKRLWNESERLTGIKP